MAMLWYVSVKNVLLRTAFGLHCVGFIVSALANKEPDVDLGRSFTIKFGYFA